MTLHDKLKELNVSPVKVYRAMFPEKDTKLSSQLAYQFFRRDVDRITQGEMRLFESALEVGKQHAADLARRKADKKERSEKWAARYRKK